MKHILSIGFLLLGLCISTTIQSQSNGFSFEVSPELNMNEENLGLGLTGTIHYWVNDYLLAGINTGFRNYNLDEKRNFIPVALSIKGLMFSAESGPYIRTDIGYGIALPTEEQFSTKANGGLLLSPSIGYERYTELGTSIKLEVGIQIQSATYEGLDVQGNDGKDVKYKRGLARISYGF